jgi:hypothetical protein
LDNEKDNSVLEYAGKIAEPGMARFVLETCIGVFGYLILAILMFFGWPYWFNGWDSRMSRFSILALILLLPLALMFLVALGFRPRDVIIGSLMIFGVLATVSCLIMATAGSM